MTSRSGDLGVQLAAWGQAGKGVQVLTDGVLYAFACVFVQKKYHLICKKSFGTLPVSLVPGFSLLWTVFCPKGCLQRPRERWRIEGRRPESS